MKASTEWKLSHRIPAMPRWAASLFVVTCLLAGSVHGIEVVVDYRYDSLGFFDDPVRRTALQAVADRYSRVITSELLAVPPQLDLGQPTTWRIGFNHPATGDLYEMSTVASLSTDAVYSAGGGAADEYGFPGLEADQWILFAGGRYLDAAGIGGTATGTNFDSIFNAIEGPMHRGVIENTPTNTVSDLPVWGGAISFGIDKDWHFALDTAVGSGQLDFYSIAMHEVGHALGLNNNWNQWSQNVSGSQYGGSHALEAYNADHGTSLSYLSLQSALDSHWADNTYQAKIFSLGEPNLVGTVGDDFQDLLMEPIANFTPDVRRFELTNVDVGALRDVGWDIIESTLHPLDRDGDGAVGLGDLDLACSGGEDLGAFFLELQTGRADFDLNGEVGFSDFLILSRGFGQAGTYSSGDANCDGAVAFADFLTLSRQFGYTWSATTEARSVPEPNSGLYGVLAVAIWWSRRRRREYPTVKSLVFSLRR